MISTCGSHRCHHHHCHDHYNLRDQHTHHHVHHHHDHHHLVGGRGGTSSEADERGSPVEDNIIGFGKEEKMDSFAVSLFGNLVREDGKYS